MTNQPSESAPIRVMVVDDSAFMRFTISKHLNETPGITVVATARDGREALDLIPKVSPDVITLDVEMPQLDGLSTLREIMTHNPLPVVMLSSLTSEGTAETVQALTLGAVDFIAKPAFKANITAVLQDVVTKVQRASRARVWPLSKQQARSEIPITHRPVQSQPPSLSTMTSPIAAGTKKTHPLAKQEKIVVIGSSTGGPRALNALVPMLPANLAAAVVIVQHMPAGFTRSLAERLDNASMLQVKEAQAGDTLEVGCCLMAPGGFHMVFDAQGVVSLNQNPPVHGVRPAVDVTMLSIAQHYSTRTIGVILTGMGSDGTNGTTVVHSSGGWVIAEAEETCVVWGMPRSVFEAGAADQVLPLPDIARAVVDAVER